MNNSYWRLARLLMVGLATTFFVGCQKDSRPTLEANPSNVSLVRGEFNAREGGATEKVNPLADPNRQPQWAVMIRGRFQIQGTAPSRKPLNVDKNKAICLAAGPIRSEKVIVGGDNGIQNVLIFLSTDLPRDESGKDSPLWVHPMYDYDKVEAGEFEAKYPQQSRFAIFNQDGCRFLTHLLAVRSDQVIKLTNSDRVGHNTKFDPLKATGTSAQLGLGEVKEHILGKQEKQPFFVSCGAHSWMGAYMISRDNPYFAVTNDDPESKQSGSFAIANVPAGVELEFRVWHEVTKFVDPSSFASFKINGQDILGSLKRGGKFKFTPEAGETYNIEAVIKASAFPSTVK
ncbi:MAG: hypothetical protein IH991_05740 [Planctomycetes bacterium]|nr:hypothetical protein [Planctomycetota bacterium]